MKYSKFFFLALASLSLQVSCKNVLEIEDINNYNPDKVWNDANLANAYLSGIYPMFGNWDPAADANSQQLIGVNFYPDRITISNGDFKNWNYNRIRLINQALVDVNSGSLSENVKNDITGQALFMRAYTYFDMVKYHGGVPYIKTPQDRYNDDLLVSRNTTKECFQFILADIDEAITKLPTKILSSSTSYGKIDGSFALAFKAKVLLYMASPQFNPKNPFGNSYWEEAYKINKQAVETLAQRGYALVPNYENITLVERNSETIFAVVNSYPNKVASWDNGVRPGSESRGNAYAVPTWELIKEYPMKDGRSYSDPKSAYYQTDAQFLQNYWANRDPRFEKSIVWNGKVYEVSGKVGKRQYTSLGLAHELDDFGLNPNAGVNSTNINRYSGFFILKNSMLKLTQAEVQQYDVDYVLMRYAEVMLNYAETANETGRSAEAIEILKKIRQRAGILAGTDGNYGIDVSSKTSIREAILAERNIEFAFEGHRFWDLRRLRLLNRLDNQTKHGVEAIAVTAAGTEMQMSTARQLAGKYELKEANFNYSLLEVPRTGVKVNVLPEKYYFFPIQESVISKNSKIAQNKDWGGTFDPTLD